MCCLFGLIDYRRSLSARQKNCILSILATACEARGTDATGIAYNSGGRLRIYKRPVPAHWMRFKVPEDARVVMGHTRMTTQGRASRNYNNHPFAGSARTGPFALAHNGVLYNDQYLRRSLRLPETRIETDSYAAVQLIEQKNALDFGSLGYMAEQVEGSFTFTVLNGRDDLYIVKGDNPMCLAHFPALGLYLYASTEAILRQALCRIHLALGDPMMIPSDCGEILRIAPNGRIDRTRFDDSNLAVSWYGPLWRPHSNSGQQRSAADDYLADLKSVAASFGYAPESVDKLLDMGFSAEELEEFLYTGEI